MDSPIMILLIIALTVFVLYLAGRILEKAGFSWKMAVVLLIPVVNIVMLWAFAFTKWPNLKDDVEQDLK